MRGPGGERVTALFAAPHDTHAPPELHSVRNTIVQFRANFDRMLEDRLRQGVQGGELAPETDVAELASFFAAMFRGIAVQARDGKSREHLLGLARVAMRVWPSR